MATFSIDKPASVTFAATEYQLPPGWAKKAAITKDVLQKLLAKKEAD